MCKNNIRKSTVDFIQEIEIKFPNKTYEIIGNYENNTTKILVKDKYGECLITPKILLKGFNPSVNSAVNSTEYCINKFKEVHGDKYLYDNFTYNGASNKSIITCKIHGDFEQNPDVHMHRKGCNKCSLISRQEIRSLTVDNFLKKAYNIHKDTYDYKLIKEYKNYLTPLSILCKIHGEFSQLPKVHLKGGGCPKCGSAISGGYDRKSFIVRSKGKECTFYIIKCFNENEEFYKIGITKYNIKKRYKTKILMPYKYEIIQEIKGEAGEIWDIEFKNKKELRDFKYHPVIRFAGESECFTKIIKI